MHCGKGVGVPPCHGHGGGFPCINNYLFLIMGSFVVFVVMKFIKIGPEFLEAVMTEERFKNKNVVQIFYDPPLAANPNKRKCRFCATET